MTAAGLLRSLRSLLLQAPDALPLSQLLFLVDDFIREHGSSSSESEELLSHLEDDLQTVHHDVVDHVSLSQTEIFLSVLSRLCPVLPSVSIISTWFDLVLRPALREPKLPTPAVNHAKQLVVFALKGTGGTYPEKVGEFRRRLLDFYLLDAFNESSGEDVLEWAELDEPSRQKRTRWKENLEDILVKFGTERPSELMTEISRCFRTPSSRLQLLTLLNHYTSQLSFYTSAEILAKHPLMTSLLTSLLLDTSSTACTIGLTILAKLLPIFAVYAREDLMRMLPQLFAILARVVTWKKRRLPPPEDAATPVEDGPVAGIPEQDPEFENTCVFQVRPDLDWQRLDLAFNAIIPSAPTPRPFFTHLYYLFPCNVLRFFREPAAYLESFKLRSLYIASWDEVLDEDQIRSRIENLLRGHILHPSIVWRDAEAELARPDSWAEYDVSRIASEAIMLDVGNAMIGMQQSVPTTDNAGAIAPSSPSQERSSIHSNSSYTTTQREPPAKVRVSIQDMLATSVALKSTLNVEIVEPTSSWPSTLLPTTTASPSIRKLSLEEEKRSNSDNNQLPSHVVLAIAGLQREVLLLRSELNFELWLARKNVEHIGRLYENRILSKTAEVERQGLHNKLRKYKAQVLDLERGLKEHKVQASSAKNKYADWNTELQKKLHALREEKKSWAGEAATLRNTEKETQARFIAQGKLLADATKQVFELECQKKETQHKVDRLRDYEREIEQHVKMQRLWDEDFKKFNERGEEIEVLRNEYKKLQMRVESHEKTIAELEDGARVYRRQILSLEARLDLANKKREGSQQQPALQISAFASETARLNEGNAKLREENGELREEVEEMKAMVELLKGQVSGRMGLISEPRASPTLSPIRQLSTI